MYNLAIVHPSLLLALLKSFLVTRVQDTSVTTSSGTLHTKSFKEIEELLGSMGNRAHNPILVHGKRHGTYEGKPTTRSFNLLRSFPAAEELAAEFSASYEWVLAEWFNTYSTHTYAFISSDPSLFEAFLAGTDRHIQHPRSGPPTVISVHRDISALRGHQSICIFYDYGIEGLFAWQLAQLDGAMPILLCYFDSLEEMRNRPELASLELLGDPVVLPTIRTTGFERVVAVYRALDQESHSAVWRTSDRDNGIECVAVSGLSDPALLRQEGSLRESASVNEDEFSSIRRLANLFDWIYGHTYGGGADEYFTWFGARDARLVSQVIDLVDSYPDKQVELVGFF